MESDARNVWELCLSRFTEDHFRKHNNKRSNVEQCVFQSKQQKTMETRKCPKQTTHLCTRAAPLVRTPFAHTRLRKQIHHEMKHCCHETSLNGNVLEIWQLKKNLHLHQERRTRGLPWRRATVTILWPTAGERSFHVLIFS